MTEYHDPEQKDYYKDGELWLLYSHSTALYSAHRPVYKHYFREAKYPHHVHLKLGDGYPPYYQNMEPKRYTYINPYLLDEASEKNKTT